MTVLSYPVISSVFAPFNHLLFFSLHQILSNRNRIMDKYFSPSSSSSSSTDLELQDRGWIHEGEIYQSFILFIHLVDIWQKNRRLKMNLVAYYITNRMVETAPLELPRSFPLNFQLCITEDKHSYCSLTCQILLFKRFTYKLRNTK